MCSSDLTPNLYSILSSTSFFGFAHRSAIDERFLVYHTMLNPRRYAENPRERLEAARGDVFKILKPVHQALMTILLSKSIVFSILTFFVPVSKRLKAFCLFYSKRQTSGSLSVRIIIFLY